MNKNNKTQRQAETYDTNRRTFLKTSVASAGAALLGVAVRANSAAAKDKAQENQEEAQYLFVQNAKGVIQEKDRLILKDISSTTIFFSDRPKRIAGHMSTEDFVSIWIEDKSKNSFNANPPNAAVSVFDDDHIVDTVYVLKNPRLTGNNLVYDIDVLEEDEPMPDGPASIFIDPIGMPLSPTSVAGVHRRHRRRRRRHVHRRHEIIH